MRQRLEFRVQAAPARSASLITFVDRGSTPPILWLGLHERRQQYLADVFRGAPPEGAIKGRTAFRDAVAGKLGCSQLAAEELVDSLVLRGNLRVISSPDAGEIWTIEVSAP